HLAERVRGSSHGIKAIGSGRTTASPAADLWRARGGPRLCRSPSSSVTSRRRSRPGRIVALTMSAASALLVLLALVAVATAAGVVWRTRTGRVRATRADRV